MTDNVPTPGAHNDDNEATAPAQPLAPAQPFAPAPPSAEAQPLAPDAGAQPESDPRTQHSYAPPQHPQQSSPQHQPPSAQPTVPYFHPQTDAFGRPIAAPAATPMLDASGGTGHVNGAMGVAADWPWAPHSRSVR